MVYAIERAHNPLVLGSSPSGPIIKSSTYDNICRRGAQKSDETKRSDTR